ncbi:MAG: peptide chain release factor 2 [Candidatus Babeliaceae bacterium]|jgi:peptide chain release factor 2
MLYDELKEKLKSIESDITTITAFWNNSHNEEEFERLESESLQENFWQNPHQATILKRLQALRAQRDQYREIITTEKELAELIVLFEHDEVELEKLKTEVFAYIKMVNRFKILLLLHEEQDSANCFLNINAGAGGTESQDWSEILLRMYVRFCEREKLTATLIDYQPGEGAGIKSGTLFIKGKNAYGLLKGEQGIHRLVRISPFDANKRRHTSFAGVFITPEADHVEITIDPKDLRVDTYRAGGAGGQHVNKTDSAVRITHFPSGIVVQCQNERSQTQNKETAMKMLMAKLVQKEKDEQQTKLSSIEKKKIEWGSQIRSYVLHPYKLVKDHRTELESGQPEVVLDGDLMDFIEAYLIWYSKK